MPAGVGYTDEEIARLTQDAFPEFDGFTPETPAPNGDLAPDLNPEDLGLPPTGEELTPEGGVPELPPLIQSIAAIDPAIMEQTPIDVKLEAIRMLIG